MEEIARKDVEFYLNKFSVINFPEREVPLKESSEVLHKSNSENLSLLNPASSVTLRPHRGHVLNCPHAELVQFWSSSGATEADLAYTSPYKDYGPNPKYVTFEPGKGKKYLLWTTLKCLFVRPRCRRMEQYSHADGIGGCICLCHRPHSGAPTRSAHVSPERRQGTPEGPQLRGLLPLRSHQ